MANSEKSNKQGMEGELPGQQFTGKQETAFQQLLRLQSDIKKQGHLVTMAINPLAEALNNGGNVSLEMMNHIKAQILLAHLQLDELEQLLHAIDWQVTPCPGYLRISVSKKSINDSPTRSFASVQLLGYIVNHAYF